MTRCLRALPDALSFTYSTKCGEMEVGAMVFSKEYGRLCQTGCAQALLQKIMEA